MDRDRNKNYSEEDLQWILENPDPDSPGLFSKSPTWVKFSSYDVKEIKDSLYICPSPGASYELYKPFEKFPQIMSDYLALLIEIDKLPKTFDNIESEEQFIRLCKKREYDCSCILLKFVNKYGLFGIMYEIIENIDPCRKRDDGQDYYGSPIVTMNRKSYSIFRRGNKLLHSHSDDGIYNFTPMMKYDDLCEYFLPNTNKPYPEIRSKQFRENYSERVMDIYMNTDMHQLTWHIKKMNKYQSENYKPDDIVPDNKNRGGSILWSQYLRQSFGDFGLSFSYDEDTSKWDLKWSFSSLIHALSIMYLMNLTGKMGSNIHTCKYSKCNKIVIDKNCCCDKHNNAYRKAKERANKSRQKEKL